MRRKDFLIGMGGLAVGVPLGAVGARSALWLEPPPPPTHGHISYAQAGEDMIVNLFFGHLKIKDISYLDIGAYDPILINNTYFFYTQGYRGVLVEPNVAMCEKLRAVRPRDTTLEAGIGIVIAWVGLGWAPAVLSAVGIFTLAAFVMAGLRRRE